MADPALRGTDTSGVAADRVELQLDRALARPEDRGAVESLLRALKAAPLLGPLEPGARLWLRVVRFLVERGAREGAEQLLARAPAAVRAWARALIDRLWPVGTGLALDASIGATFGVPLQANLAGSYLMVRVDATDVQLVRRGVLQGGLDTGIGAGGFLRVGTQGVGASAGAQAQLGLQVTVVDELRIPVFGDAGLGPLLVYLASLDSLARLGALVADYLAALSPDPFRTKLKLELKVVASAMAAAEAGVRSPEAGDTRRVRGARFDRAAGKPTDSRVLPWRDEQGRFDWRAVVQNILRAGVTGSIELDAGGGVEITPAYTGRELTAVDLALYAEGEGSAALFGAVARLSQLGLRAPLAGGGGLRVVWRATAPFGADRVAYLRHELYLKQGDLDVYAGDASEVTLALPWDPRAFTSLDAFLAGITRATIHHRVAIGSPLGSKYLLTLARQQRFTVLLGPTYREKGFSGAGYATIKLVMPREVVVRVLARVGRFVAAELQEDPAVIAALDGLATGAPPGELRPAVERAVASTLARAGEHLRTFLTTGALPPAVHGLLDELAAIVIGGVEQLELHVELGLGFAAGATAAKGAKARVHVAAAGRVVFREDVAATLRTALGGAVLDLRELLGLLRGEQRGAPAETGFTPAQLR